MIKVSLETYKEILKEINDFYLEKKSYFEFLHRHFYQEHPSLLEVVLDYHLRVYQFITGTSPSSLMLMEAKSFFLLLLRLLEKEGEKEKIKLPQINPKVIRITIDDLLKQANKNKLLAKKIELSAEENSALKYSLKAFAPRHPFSKEEKNIILSLGLSLLKIIQSQEEVDRLEKDLKGDERNG